VKPVYPAASRAAGIEGNVLISATIDKFGTVVNPKVVSKVDPDLAAAALDAVRQWRYKPALLNGQPMDIITVITVNFSLVD
jgi:protein TonB